MNETLPQLDSHYLAIIEKLADVTATLRSLEASVREKREDITHAHERINKVEAKIQLFADTADRNLAATERNLASRADKAKDDLDTRIRMVEMRAFAGVVLCAVVVGVVVPIGLHYLDAQDNGYAPVNPSYKGPQQGP